MGVDVVKSNMIKGIIFLVIAIGLLLSCENASKNRGARQSASQSREQGKGDFYPFADNGDGTITDEVTGLMWTKSAYSDIKPQSPWECKVAGYSNWRLPTLVELRGLYNSLGMMTKYRATDSKNRTTHPFEWPFHRTCWANSGEQPSIKDGKYDDKWVTSLYEFDFSNGERRIFDVMIRRPIYIRFVRSEGEKGYVGTICPQCGGSGVILRNLGNNLKHEEPCSKCGGTGRITVRDK